ncbi:hypothetical protein [Companilactobacillus sp. HBUAS56275]|jgi:Fatty acid desaturase|uniref:Uncharacterized protein n=1 Tax=Candidatus Companilactobacillus pullicola TaxID=2838523 RepID=A0A9D1ZN94_9LACO|nr:hypothetical protein [Candidatus Companilactobacillus pullicola]
MIKFGKRVNYRPLIISLVLGLFPGLIFAMVGFGKIPSILVGIGIFLVFFVGYYFRILPVLFNYWEVGNGYVQYINLNKTSARFKALLLPFSVHMKTIDFNSIKSATIKGDLSKLEQEPMAIPYSGYLAVITAVLSIIHNPVDITFELTDGTSITVGAARDMVYGKDKAIKKLEKMLNQMSDAKIQVIDQTDHKVKLV